jgi:hypothetical protein
MHLVLVPSLSQKIHQLSPMNRFLQSRKKSKNRSCVGATPWGNKGSPHSRVLRLARVLCWNTLSRSTKASVLSALSDRVPDTTVNHHTKKTQLDTGGQVQGQKNRLPGRLGQVDFHTGLVLIADHLPVRASAFSR